MPDKKRTKTQKKADRQKTVTYIKTSKYGPNKVRKISKNAARRKVNRKMSQDISPVDKPLTILIKDNAKNKRPPSIKSML
jgi:hypothetical protein